MLSIVDCVCLACLVLYVAAPAVVLALGAAFQRAPVEAPAPLPSALRQWGAVLADIYAAERRDRAPLRDVEGVALACDALCGPYAAPSVEAPAVVYPLPVFPRPRDAKGRFLPRAAPWSPVFATG